MRFSGWLGSVQFLFSSRSNGMKQARFGKRVRQRDHNAFQKVEGLEPRKMLAFEYVASYIEAESPFHQAGDVATPSLDISPQQVVLRFTPETQIDPASVSGGITVERSGRANDPFGETGSFQDVTVSPGAIVVDDAPNENQVVIRFANSLPDDSYQITINGLTTLPDETGAVEQFNNGLSTTVPFRLSLGPNVVSVVPQPIDRPNIAGDPEDLSLSQSANEIVVYFDSSEPMERASVEDTSLYQLIEIDEATAAEQGTVAPTTATYSAATNSVSLQFAAIDDNKTFRLEIGGSGLPVAPSAIAEAGAGTSFATAQNGLGDIATPNVLPAEGVLITGEISTNPTITSTAPVVPGENNELNFPGNPGSINESGHRDIPVNLGGERHGQTLPVGPAAAIPTRFYNFRSDYGTDPQGQPLANQITETQKQRTREIFEIFSRYLGVQFVESADLTTDPAQTMTIATGDLRAFDTTLPTTPAGLAGQTTTGNVAIMDSTENWGLSEYGGFWFRTAMQQIGELLGLHHSFDLPSIMGGGLNGEAIFPGDYDLVEARQLFPNAGSDIDLYTFTLSGDGLFTAESIVNRPGDPVTSKLDTVLTLYREDPATSERTIIARNDDSFGSDSRIEIDLTKTNTAGADYIYYVAVTAAGNDLFNPEIEESGSGGQSQGAYQLSIKHVDKASSSNTVTDASGTPLDGDRDGQAGGVFSFWFQTAEASKTIYVDKIATAAWTTVTTEATNTAELTVDDATGILDGMRVYGSNIPEGVTVVGAPVGNVITISEAIPPTAIVAANTGLRFATAEADQDGSLANPFTTVKAAIAEANSFTTDIRTIRIVGNEGNEVSSGLVANSSSAENPHHYYVGKDDQGKILSDGETFIVPAGVTVMIDEGASFRMRRSIVEVGSSSPLSGDSRAGACLQVLGVPNKPVQFSSTDRQFDASAGPAPLRSRGHWGGLVFRADSDWQGDVGREVLRPFLNTVNGSIISYGGGQAVVDSQTQAFASIQIEGTRPSLGFNTITTAAGAAIAATPQSFEEGNGRIGVDLRGNQLFDNSVNGVFLLIDTEFGSGTQKLDISARFNDTEVVHVLQENLFIEGGAGGFVRDTNGIESIRPSGRLQIDPGVVVKSYGGRIELERGRSQLIAEGEGYDKVIFTSFGDNRYGAGGTFDSNGNLPDTYAAGDWGGIVGNVGSDISIDNAYLAHAGGLVAIEGGFDRFNAIETHQGDLRLANTRLEFNADGNATGTRNARGGNEAATIFVRGSQPIIAGNDLRNNAGATISINSNALTDTVQADYGRQTGAANRFGQFDLNQGPLIRENRISDTLGGDSSVTSEFTIDVIYGTGLNANIETATAAAVARWEEIIIGDLSDQGAIDDFQITVQAGLLGDSDSDGTGNTLANAGPLLRRSASDPNPFLPYTGQVGVDMADTGNVQQLTEVMIHELGHALGFVSNVLDDFNYLDANTNFLGPQALAQYQNVSPGAQSIPMQVGGSHWDETEFGVEIMTPSWNPNSVLSMLTVGLFDDLGYEVNYARADPYTTPGGTELFPPAGASAGSAIAGMDIRAEEVTGEKVWDDADIVHVLRDSIEVNNFHTETGLKLLSNSQSSLVVKLDSPDAGLTASGEALDIRDRIGGSVQIIGQPGYPVVLTSLADDTVGASLDINGFPVFDTNADGTDSTPSAGNWRSLKFDPLSNDRNVGIFVESERAYTAGLDVNSDTTVAEYVGIIAPNNPETNLVGQTNTFESTQEKNGNDAQRLGFEVHGTIAADDPTDVDVYSFYGYGGSEVWFDIDKTSDALDTQLEILDASGNVLARSFDSINDIGVERANSSADIGGTLVATTATFDIGNVNILPGTLAGVIYQGNTATQEFSVGRDGMFAFTAIGDPASEATATSALNRETGIVTLEFDVAPTAPLELRDLSYEFARVPLDADGLAFLADGGHGAYSLNKDAHRGPDSYSSNPRDAGLRMTLPGVAGRQSQYFVRVRSQAEAGTPVDTLDEGKTSGRYQLRMRLRQQDEKPGSVVTFADVRYATTGIDVTGLPNNTPLTGTAGEDKTANDTSSAAQQLGNLLAIDRNTISVAGDMSSATDVDWYEFEVGYEQIQVLEGINDGTKSWATTFDIDFGSGVRGDYTISVFDADTNELIYVGRDSNIADDVADPLQGDTDADDLTRGSAGVNDPFIGTVQLTEGTYYVAVSTNAQLPNQLDQNFVSAATNPEVRLEPLSSLNRIVDDKIGSTGYFQEAGFFGVPAQNDGRSVISTQDGFALQANVQPFTLADMTVFITEGNRLRTINPFTGVADSQPGGYTYAANQSAADLDMLSDGRLVVYMNEGSNANAGTVYVLDPATGGRTQLWGDSIANVPGNPQATDYWQTNGSPDALAIGYSGVAVYNAGSNNAGSSDSATYYAVSQGNVSRLYGGQTNGDASSNTAAPPGHRFGYMGDIDPATITSKTVGLQFLNENRNLNLYGVSEDGQFFRIIKKGHGGQAPPTDVQVDDVVDFGTILGGRQLGGLATGPVNLEGGRFAGTFFAVTTDGELFCIDPTGGAGGEAVIVDNIFDSDGDGIADSWISNPTGNNVRGVAFSPLDVNLWHPTTDRNDSIPASTTHDLTRAGSISANGQSMHFGLEEWVAGNTPYVEYTDVDGGGAGQFGVRSSGVWQRHLSAGLGISESTYNLPGGAHGRMQTDAFSLAGYTATDKPTLYFSYWLETQDAQDNQGGTDDMRDSARVLGSVDGGATWELLATNNQERSSLDAGPQAELPPRLTPSSNAANAGSNASERQQVQELFDTAEWRQARVDLAQFAGESSVLLRFDFSTGGDLDRRGEINNAKIVADATREVVAITAVGNGFNDVTVELDSVQGLVEVVGNIAKPNAEIVFNELEVSTGTAMVISIDTAANTVVLRPDDVTVDLENVLSGGDLIDFFSAGVNQDNINGLGGTLGDFGSPTARSEDNNYRGFNIDNIMVGFAERGEAVVNATSEPNAQFFTFNEDRSAADYPEQVLQGEYQLEIRRGSEFGSQDTETIGFLDPTLPGEPTSGVTINNTFDTNDRMVRETAVISHELEVNFLGVVDGVVVTEAGHPVLPFGAGTILQGDGGNLTTQHSALKWAVDLANQPAAVLEFNYSVNEDEQLTQLPNTFTIVDETDLPTGDGVALSVDGGINWVRIANFSTTTTGAGTYESSLEIDLLQAGLVLTDTTVIGFFRSDANEGGITVRNAVIRTAPVVTTSGLVGDKNNEFENQQGQFIVQNTIVTNASTYGIRIDAGRVGDGSQSPDLGVAQNRAVLNNAGLVPGAVVTNTVVANSGVAGIYFGGSADTANDADSVRPYGRLVNNTIYGGGSGIGIDVANNAAPTILNNVFAELDTGIQVDSSSRLDDAGNAGTVIGTSAFYLVGTEVEGATQSLGLTLTEDPFVNKARNNFYPAANSRIIDSSMNSLEDRPGFEVVKDAINIPESPILAPQKDLYGLTRDDDPDVASIPGLGLNAFKDRGAIERLDLTQPEASLAVPLDQSKVAPVDLNNTLHAVDLQGDAARQQEKFVLQLSDIGTGIDQVSVTQNENTSVTVTGVYARSSGDFVNLNTLTLDTVDYSGLLANASVSINNVDAGVTVTSIAGTTLTLSGPVTAVDNSVISFGFGDTTSVSTNRVVVSDASSVNAGILVNGIGGVASANAISAVDAAMNTIDLEEAATLASDTEITLTAFLLQRDGQVLEAGNDYFFQYNTNTNQVVFAAASTFTLGDYELRVAPTVQDLGGNSLLVNDTVNGTTEFTIGLLDVPSAPSAPLGVSGDQQVTLSWGVPSTSVSAPITDYIIETSDDDGQTWVVFDDGTSTLTTAVVTTHDGVALSNGTPYRFRVLGVNRVGNGEFSPQSAAVTPLRLPTAPLNLAVVAGNAVLDFSWTAPTDDGEDLTGTDSILDYVVEYSSDAGASWTAHTPNPTTTSTTVSGLTGGVGYLLRVAARNARDQGDYATTTVAEIPQGPPGLVQNLVLVAGVGQVTLDWDPGTDGALGIDEYVVKFSINSAAFVDDNWNSNVAGPVTETGLNTGDTVVAEVFAKNANGDGPVATSNTVVVAGTPGVVTDLTFTEEDGAIGLSWTAPADTGGYPVEDYIIESTADNGASWVAESDVSTATSVTMSSHNGVPLVNGNEYSFRVSVKTSIATGVSTEINGGPAVPHTVPSAPVLNAPTSDNGSIGITWSAPDNGGKPISDYVVQYKRASRTQWTTYADGTSTATSATITGVFNGVSYVVRVAAVNPKGQGAWSAESTSVVPGNVPDQIADLAATAQDGAVALTWTVPASTLTVTSHELQYKKQGDSTWIPFSGTIAIEESAATATVSGLTNGETYDFEVVAVNAVGSSPAASASATPFALPGAVTNFAAVNTGNSVNKSWSAPSSNGGGTISDYVVQYRLASSSTWITFNDGVSTSLSANTTGLSVGQTYVFQVAAKTEFGTGPFTQSGEVTVGSTPVAPARVGAWKEGGNIHVLWDLVQMPAGVTFQYYQIQYREVGVGDWSTIGTDLFNKDVFAGSNFTSGKTYEFRVAAVANTGVGAYRVNLNNVTY